MPPKPAVFVHGGAGSLGALQPEEISARKASLTGAVKRAFRTLTVHGATDAVETAISALEDSGMFNAGRGACLTLDGTVELDAGIMDGKNLAAAGVARLTGYMNAIRVARRLMDNTDHVLMIGDDAELIPRLTRLRREDIRPSDTIVARWWELIERWRRSEVDPWPKNRLLLSEKDWPIELGTVGAVAIDAGGNVAAGVSTGGRWLKLRGRVGDSAIVGAGFYADNQAGAAAATGMGEEIMKICLAKAVVDGMRRGLHPQAACDESIHLLTERRGPGTAGIIAVDQQGHLGYAFNTEVMGRAYLAKGMVRPVVRFSPERGRKAARPHARLLI